MATWIVGAQTIGRTLGEILNHSLLVTTPPGAIIAAVPLTDGGEERAKLIASAPDLAKENARLQGALLRLLIAATRNAGGRATADAVREAKALVPVTCEHCPDHPHPLDDDETPCRLPRPAPSNPATPQPAPDVQTALADALLLCVKWMPLAEVRSWPPGFRLREEALAKASAALLLVGRKP